MEAPTHSEGTNGDGERPSGDWRIGKEHSQCFPCPLRTREPAEVPGQILHTLRPCVATGVLSLGPAPA